MSTQTLETIEAISLPRRPARRESKDFVKVMRNHQIRGDAGTDWMNDPDNPPACQGLVTRNPELDHAFFPDNRGDNLHVIVRTTLCATCPVKAACLQFAYDNDCVGVWGGECITHFDASERRKTRLCNNHLAQQKLRYEVQQLIAATETA